MHLRQAFDMMASKSSTRGDYLGCETELETRSNLVSPGADPSRYIVEKYGRLPSHDSQVKKLSLLLRRFESQTLMDDLQKIPIPSQVDDFLLYNRMIENDIRARDGEAACEKWLMDMQSAAKEKKKSIGDRNSSAALDSFIKYKLAVIESERAV